MKTNETSGILEKATYSNTSTFRLRWLQAGNLIFFLLMVFVNFLANFLPLNGKTTGQLSGQYPNLFVPAGLTFSVWGVIYLSLFIFCLYQFRHFAGHRSEDFAVVRKVDVWFILSCIFNLTWIFAWHYEQVELSVALMLGLLISLIRLNIRLGVGLFKSEPGEKYAVHLPFALYMGWISVATITNITAWLVNIRWDGWGFQSVVWTLLMISIATLLTLWVVGRTNSIFYGLVVIWAFAGIALRQYQSGQPFLVIVFAVFAAILLVLVMVISRSRRWASY
jgi:hypothetical protein